MPDSSGRTVTEGHIPFRGYRTWYRVVGDGDDPGKLPVLCLHGGPGATHDYLKPFEDLADSGRGAIFYDQLGCGNSAISEPHEPSMWTTELFVEEVDAVRDALGLDRIHLLGQSWGGMLAMQYALTRPAGLASLVIESSPASVPQWLVEVNRLRTELPPAVEAELRHHEAAGTTDSAEYQMAMLTFYQRHVCRLDPWPECLVRTFAKLEANPEVYATMNGPSEFHVIGVIKDWDITERLSEIEVPALILSGRHDEVTPATMERVHRGIARSEWVVLEESSHTCHLEERQRTLHLVGAFLARVEGDR